jgi:hypothetical protein
MNEVCKSCAAQLEPTTKFCGSCGSAVASSFGSPEAAVSHSRPANGGRRYPALRIIALLLKIVAALTAIGGAITGLSAASITSSLPAYPGFVVLELALRDPQLVGPSVLPGCAMRYSSGPRRK